MSKKFAKENYNSFSSDLTNTDILKVIKFIMKADVIDCNKTVMIRQFLNNWVTVGCIIEKYQGGTKQ